MIDRKKQLKDGCFFENKQRHTSLMKSREAGTMNQRELADGCLMDVTTTSRTLDRMEKEDLVRRERNPQSRRSWNIIRNLVRMS